MDTEFLKRKVGDVLAEGFAELFLLKPEDPVEYLADWLIKYQQNCREREEVSCLKYTQRETTVWSLRGELALFQTN